MPAFFMFEFEIGFLGLFLTSFLAATVIPIASEAFLIAMLSMGYHPIVCLFCASAGNTLGDGSIILLAVWGTHIG